MRRLALPRDLRPELRWVSVCLAAVLTACAESPTEPEPSAPDVVVATEEGRVWAFRESHRGVREVPLPDVEGVLFQLDPEGGPGSSWLLGGNPIVAFELDFLGERVTDVVRLADRLDSGPLSDVTFGPYSGGAVLHGEDPLLMLGEATRPSNRIGEADVGIVEIGPTGGSEAFLPEFLMGGDGLAAHPSRDPERFLLAGVRPRRSREAGFLFEVRRGTGEVADSLQLTEVPGSEAGGIRVLRSSGEAGTVVVETLDELVVLRLSPMRVVGRIPVSSGPGGAVWTLGIDGRIALAREGAIAVFDPEAAGVDRLALPEPVREETIRSVALDGDRAHVHFTTGPTRGEVATGEDPAGRSFLHRIPLAGGGEIRTVPIPGFRPEILYVR